VSSAPLPEIKSEEAGMQGYLITFFTQQDRMHQGVPLAQWLFDQASQLGLEGVTLNAGIAGMGHDGRRHAINLFDLSDQPVQVSMVLDSLEVERLFADIGKEDLRVFYTKAPVEFGVIGKGAE
jgi:uncharacterized protein